MCAASARLCTAMSTSCCCARRSSLPALPGAASESTSAAIADSSDARAAAVAVLVAAPPPSTCTKLDSLSPDCARPGECALVLSCAEAVCGVGTQTGVALSGRGPARCRSSAKRVANAATAVHHSACVWQNAARSQRLAASSPSTICV